MTRKEQAQILKDFQKRNNIIKYSEEEIDEIFEVDRDIILDVFNHEDGHLIMKQGSNIIHIPVCYIEEFINTLKKTQIKTTESFQIIGKM